MNIQFLNIITYTQTALSALVTFFCWLHFSKRDTSVKLLGLAFFVGFLSNSVSLLMFFNGFGRYTNIPQSIYGVLNFGIVCLFYFHVLKQRYAKCFIVIFLSFIVFAVCNFLFWQGTTALNSYTDSLSSILIIVITVFYFYRLMVELPAIYIHQLPSFWFSSAYLIYRAGSMILFVFTSYLVNVMKDNMLAYWCFHNLLSIVEHILILVGLRYDLKKTEYVQ